MRELVLTRHNELIDPLVGVWGWEIPVYLFLGGLVAGMMIIAGSFVLRGRHRSASCVCSVLPGLGFAFLSLGMLALFLDLEHKRYVWRLYTTFRVTSPMSWGAWILMLVYPALAILALVHPPAIVRDLSPAIDRLSARLGHSETMLRATGAAAVVLGIALGIYTGILLSGLGARPFWSSAMLGPLFLVSGLSSAAAFTHLVARDPAERALLGRWDNMFLLIELFVIGLFLVGLQAAGASHQQAAALVLGGPFTAVFWVLVVALGIAVPLLIQSLAVANRVHHAPIAPVLVMAGGLALRFVVVYAGQMSHWVR